jgi:hypothetical protein
MLNGCEPPLPWHWHHRLQAHGILEAMEVNGMEQVKTEKWREAKTELTHASKDKNTHTVT